MRYFITLQVKTKTALHVGSHADGATDSLFRRTAQGGLVLPGTSIAGALRSHLTRIVPSLNGTLCQALQHKDKRDKDKPCRCIVCHLMGDINPINVPNDGQGKLEERSGRASRLIIEDALIQTPKTHVRDGVGIERSSRAASRQGQAKFDFETIPAGTAFNIKMELEDANNEDKALLVLAIEEWQAGHIRVGGNTRRGLGVLKIMEIVPEHLNIEGDLKDLFEFLKKPTHKHSNNTLFVEGQFILKTAEKVAISAHTPVLQSWLQIDYTIQFNGFFVSNDTGEALFQGFNVVSTTNLHGSSIRGILRSHAERIARTMTNLEANDEKSFLDKCPAADPTATYTEDNVAPMLESLSSRIYRLKSAQSVRENLTREPEKVLDYLDLADQFFGSPFQGSRFFVEDAHLEGQPQWKPLDFVAIDRFTGGAADQKKFDALALWRPQFKGRLFLESPQLWELGWLWMLLRDWREGFITFGYGASKGFGQVSTVDFDILFGWTHPESTEFVKYLEALGNPNSSFWKVSPSYQWDTLPAELKHDSVKAWQKRVREFKVRKEVAHQLPDPYWSLAELYSQEIVFNE